MCAHPEAQVTWLLASIFVSVIPLVFVWYRIARNMGSGEMLAAVARRLCGSVLPLSLAGDLATASRRACSSASDSPVSSSRRRSSEPHHRPRLRATGRRRKASIRAVSGFITRSSGLISALAFLIVGDIFAM